MGLFNVVQFANSACNATDDSRTGVCYTSSECEAKGGTSGGVCAAGFGVCCICKGDLLGLFFKFNMYFQPPSVFCYRVTRQVVL